LALFASKDVRLAEVGTAESRVKNKPNFGIGVEIRLRGIDARFGLQIHRDEKKLRKQSQTRTRSARAREYGFPVLLQ
jgi:hypothetical protein